MNDYLEPTDPNAFKNIEKKDPQVYHGTPAECPVCKGHGSWNLRLNAYGPKEHFQASCSQCNGWGYVEKGSLDETCIHEYKEISAQEAEDNGITHFGKCYHVYKCTKCGRFQAYDSSD